MIKSKNDNSIDGISIEAAMELLELSEVETSFLEQYIPSKDVRDKIKSDKWVFSDRDKATIIWNSDKPYIVKHTDLINIMKETDDQTLKGQISERIRFDAIAFSCFEKNRNGFIYAASTNEFPGENNVIGYFDSMKSAYEACKRDGYSFKIEKYQILGENIIPMKNWSTVSPIIIGDEEKQVEAIDIPGSPIATMEYDEAGKLIHYWTSEMPKEDIRLVNSLGRHRFENAYVVFPNPFELGDNVINLKTHKIGRVNTAQDDWKKYVEHALKENAIDDYSDASILIKHDYRNLSHSHISPIYLERIKPERDFKPIICQGHDSGDSFWIRPIRITSDESIYINEVEELEGEFSVPAKYVEGIVLEIFKRYLNMGLSCNKRRSRFDYDPDGKSVIGFGIGMVHNFYDSEHIKMMAANMTAVALYICDRSFDPEIMDISEAVINEIQKFDCHIAELNEDERIDIRWKYACFLRDLSEHLLELIYYRKATIISIMAP